MVSTLSSDTGLRREDYGRLRRNTSMRKPKWIITAQNSAGDWLYYCENLSQGGRMVPNAESMARTFGSRLTAIRYACGISKKYCWSGLKNWAAITAMLE